MGFKMDFTEKQIFLAALLIFTGAAAGLNFDVSVAQEFRYDAKNLQYDSKVEGLQNLNVSIMNAGSVSCNFRLKTVYNSTSLEQAEQQYSEPHDLLPSQYGMMRTFYIPEQAGNYTADMHLRGCGQWEELRRVNFTVQNTSQTDEKIDFTRKSADEGYVNIETEEETALAVPEEAPPYWQVSPAEIRNGTARLEYTPEVFNPDKNITYNVVNRSTGQVLGSMEVPVEPKETLLQRIDLRHVAAPLAASIILNLLLIYRVRSRTRHDES